MPAVDVSIRAYRPDDLPVLRSMTAEAFDGVSIDQGIEAEFGLVNGHDWQWRKSRHVDADVDHEPDGVFVLEVDGRIGGFVSSRMDAEAGVGSIPNLVVDAPLRGRGFGRRLLEHVLQRFRDHGLTVARIETLVQNEVGAGLYESLGFREVARQIHFATRLDEERRSRTGL